MQEFKDTQLEHNWQNNPLLRPLKPEDMDKIDLEWSKSFFETAFSNPAEFTFIFVGNMGNLERSIDLIEQYIGSIKRKTTGIYDQEERKNRFSATYNQFKPQFRPGVTKKIIYKGIDSKSVVNIGFPIQPMQKETRFATIMFAQLLEAKLREILRTKLGKIYDLAVSPQFIFTDLFPGEIDIVFSCDPIESETLVNLCVEVIKSYQLLGPTPSELHNMKLLFEKQWELSLFQREHWLNQLYFGVQSKDFLDKPGLNVTMEQASYFYRYLFPLKNYSVVVLYPETMMTTGIFGLRELSRNKKLLVGVGAVIGIIGIAYIVKKWLSK